MKQRHFRKSKDSIEENLAAEETEEINITTDNSLTSMQSQSFVPLVSLDDLPLLQWYVKFLKIFLFIFGNHFSHGTDESQRKPLTSLENIPPKKKGSKQ
jgi:hypothetical protein